MTTSRDSAKTNAYPGEVRAGELAMIRTLFEHRVATGAAALLLGDFNTSAGSIDVFRGKLTATEGLLSRSPLTIDTGFVIDDAERNEVISCALHWVDAKGAAVMMREAFEEEHRWGAGVKAGTLCGQPAHPAAFNSTCQAAAKPGILYASQALMPACSVHRPCLLEHER